MMVRKLSPHWIGLLCVAALLLIASPIAAQTATPTPPTFPLADPGSYAVGFRSLKLTDLNRDGREMDDDVWYPGIPPANPTRGQQSLAKNVGWGKAPPDLKAAPAPLILISPGWTQSVTDFTTVAMTLASRGFVVVGLDHPAEDSGFSFVNRPMDVLYAIEQVAAANQTDDFGGLIDTDHIGVMGDSYGAYTTLVLTGARIDPAAASAVTAAPFVDTGFNDNDPRTPFRDWTWDAIAAYRAKFDPQPQSGDLWPPFTDKRIQAAVMFSPCWAQMFGEKGLAAATVPSLIIGGTADTTCPYANDDVYDFDHLGSPDHYLLTYVKGDHVPGLDFRTMPFTTQMFTAFFDKYLKGQSDDAQDLSADYVNSVESQLHLGLVWGAYTGS